MKQQKRKGFTLVELLIVIAILAILATVSIVGYTTFVKKAKISNDTALAKQINDYLIADETINGKPGTLGGALAIVGEGFNVVNLTPTAQGYDFVYDVENNRFALMEGEKVVYSASDRKLSDNLADRWVMRADEKAERLEGYSVYFKNPVATLTLNKLIGVEGEIGTLNVDTEDAGSIVIAGNIGEVTIDAPNAEVDHSGVVGKVNITAIKDKSWHEHGEITGNITIAKGHFVAESGSVVSAIIVSSNTVTIKAENGATVKGVAPAENVTLDTTKLEGISQEVISSTPVSEETLSLFAGGIGTKESPYLIATEEQFANINKLAAEMANGKQYYFAQTANLNVTSCVSDFAGGYDGGGYSISSRLSTKKGYYYLFAALKGHATFSNMKIVMNSDYATALLSDADWESAYGADFINLEFTAKNTINCNVGNFGFVVINPLYTLGSNDVVYNFKDITSDVNLTNAGSCTSFLVGSGPCFCANNTTVYYENCVNNGIITGTNYVGFLYGNPSYIASITEDNGGKLVVKNCYNKGVLMSVNDKAIVELAPNYAECNEQYQSAVGGSYVKGNYLANKEFTVNQTGESFTINTTDTTVTYKLALSVGSTYYTNDGSAWTDAHTQDVQNKTNKLTFISNSRKFMIDLTVNTEATGACNKFKAYDKRTAVKEGIIAAGDKIEYNDNGFAIVVKDGINNVIFDCGADMYINSNVSLLVYAYSADGTMVGMITLK